MGAGEWRTGIGYPQHKAGRGSRSQGGTRTMARRIDVTGAGGVRLAAWEFGDPPKTDPPTAGSPKADPADGAPPYGTTGERAPGVLLLHGLMGRASHWASTARWLSERHRAVALDQRGHG